MNMVFQEFSKTDFLMLRDAHYPAKRLVKRNK
jgi:hypothetical protein